MDFKLPSSQAKSLPLYSVGMSTKSDESNNSNSSFQTDPENLTMGKVDHKGTLGRELNQLDDYCKSAKRSAIAMRNENDDDGANCTTPGKRIKRQKTEPDEAQIEPSDCFELIDPSMINLNFPYRLRKILDNKDYSSTIRWHPNGLAFKVFNIVDFEQNIIPKYFFRKCKYWSFTRRLGRWGFLRIASGPEFGSYHHPLFKRDEPDLMTGIKCLTYSEEQGPRATTDVPLRSTSHTERGYSATISEVVGENNLMRQERSHEPSISPGATRTENASVPSISDSANLGMLLDSFPFTSRMDGINAAYNNRLLSSGGVQATIMSRRQDVSQELQPNNLFNSIDRDLLSVRLAVEVDRHLIRQSRINAAVQNHVLREYIQQEEISEILRRNSHGHRTHFNQNILSPTAMLSNHALPRLFQTGQLSSERLPIPSILLHPNVNPVTLSSATRSSFFGTGTTSTPFDFGVRTSHHQDLIRDAQIISRHRLQSQFQLPNGLAPENRSYSNLTQREGELSRILHVLNPSTVPISSVFPQSDRSDLIPSTAMGDTDTQEITDSSRSSVSHSVVQDFLRNRLHRP